MSRVACVHGPTRSCGPWCYALCLPVGCGSCEQQFLRTPKMIALRAPSHSPTGTPTLPHAEPRAAGASHALLQAHRVKTARTSPRARKHEQRHFRAVPCASTLCWRPMAVPRRPHQLRASRTTRASRISTHAATCAPQHTSPALPRLFAPCAGSAHCFWHLTSGCTRTRREYDADAAPRKARTHARTRARARTRAHLLSLLHSLTACLHTHHTAPCARTALNDAARTPQPALHEARAWHAARTHARTSARARSSALCCTDRQPACTHSVELYSTMGTHTPNDAARTPQQ